MNHEHIIREYYRRVDKGDLDWVLDLFADNSEYTRADACYASKAEIEAFYRRQRKIAGVHTLEHLYQSGETVIVDGCFDGKGADGSEKHVGFADFWQFDPDGRVANRRTYLALGSQVVRD